MGGAIRLLVPRRLAMLAAVAGPFRFSALLAVVARVVDWKDGVFVVSLAVEEERRGSRRRRMDSCSLFIIVGI